MEPEARSVLQELLQRMVAREGPAKAGTTVALMHIHSLTNRYSDVSTFPIAAESAQQTLALVRECVALGISLDAVYDEIERLRQEYEALGRQHEQTEGSVQ